jgi:hypothetical protein
MKRSILLLIIGLLLGAAGTAYFFGRSRLHALSASSPKPPPDQSSATSGTVAVTIDEKFFDSLLGTVFSQLGPPQLKLSPNQSQASCNDAVVLNAQDGNVTTGVKFTGGRITAPLAFTGSYNVLSKCMEFKGAANAIIDLSFDQSQQAVVGQLNVDEVNLDGVSTLVSGLVTAFVRKTLADRVNPFQVLRVSQLNLSVPIQASGGLLKAQVKDVRPEVQEGSLKLYLVYDFSGERSQ